MVSIFYKAYFVISLHSFWFPGVWVHANGAILIKMPFSILESVALVELIGATFKYATLYKLI
jgi:hypothetical protein